ncbi:MAG: ribonuclease P protein component [Bacillaceae bacterium]
MKKLYRVKKNADFQVVFQEGKSDANRQFVIYQYKKENQPYFRIGLSVSKKLGNAVTRNRIKRLIRQVFTELKDDIKIGNDYVIIARKPCVELEYDEFKKCLMHVLKRGNIYSSR